MQLGRLAVTTLGQTVTETASGSFNKQNASASALELWKACHLSVREKSGDGEKKGK